MPRFEWHHKYGAAWWRDKVRFDAPAVLRGSPFLGDTSSKARSVSVHFHCLNLGLLTLLHSQFVADHKPGVLHTWTWAHLSTVAGEGGGTARNKPPAWPCLVSAPGKDRFLFCDPDKNVYGGYYHVRVRARAVCG